MFKIGRAEITGGFMLLMSALYLMDKSGMFPAFLFAVLIHELGHVAAVKLCGGEVTGIVLDISGLRIEYDGSAFSYRREIIAALSGPAASLGLAYAASWFGNQTGSEVLLCVAGASIILCVFNLLPVRQLDGGRALFMALAVFFDIDLVERILCIVSCVTIFATLALGAVLLIVSGWNFTWLLISFWLLMGYCK